MTIYHTLHRAYSKDSKFDGISALSFLGWYLAKNTPTEIRRQRQTELSGLCAIVDDCRASDSLNPDERMAILELVNSAMERKDWIHGSGGVRFIIPHVPA